MGTHAARRGLAPLEALLTETEPFRALGLPAIAAVAFGGCDLRAGPLADSVSGTLSSVGSFPAAMVEALLPELAAIPITSGILRGGANDRAAAREVVEGRSAERRRVAR